MACKKKRVSFSDELVTVYNLDDEGKRERKGPWMYIARDRIRFQHRINVINLRIGYIFQAKHRLWWWQRLITVNRRHYLPYYKIKNKEIKF